MNAPGQMACFLALHIPFGVRYFVSNIFSMPGFLWLLNASRNGRRAAGCWLTIIGANSDNKVLRTLCFCCSCANRWTGGSIHGSKEDELGVKEESVTGWSSPILLMTPAWTCPSPAISSWGDIVWASPAMMPEAAANLRLANRFDLPRSPRDTECPAKVLHAFLLLSVWGQLIHYPWVGD